MVLFFINFEYIFIVFHGRVLIFMILLILNFFYDDGIILFIRQFVSNSFIIV